MSTEDDTEIIPADDRGDTPSPSGRTHLAPAQRREMGRTLDGMNAALSPTILTAFLRALSVWST
jgi:hypothetical protein